MSSLDNIVLDLQEEIAVTGTSCPGAVEAARRMLYFIHAAIQGKFCIVAARINGVMTTLHANQEFQTFIGYTEEELQGLHASDLIYDDDVDMINEIQDNNGSYKVNHRIVKKSGGIKRMTSQGLTVEVDSTQYRLIILEQE